MKLSLGMIFKDETSQFKRILNAYGHLFDEIVIAVDDRISDFKEIASSYPSMNIKIFPYSWCNDFAHKRNFVAYHVTGDMYMRLDADDEISEKTVQHLRAIAEKEFNAGTIIVYGYYNYARDQWGNVNAAHWREVLIKNTDILKWNKKIHENLICSNMDSFKMTMSDGVIINHLSSEEKINASLMRNIKYLLEEYNENKEDCDSRTLSYLGRMLHGVGAFDKAIYFLELHIKTSGWDEDRYMSWCQLADCYRQKEKEDMAIAACFEAMQECPEFPDSYLKLHDIYFQKENWQKAEFWGRQGLLKAIPKNFMMIDPSAYGWRPILSMAFTMFQLNKFEEALKLFELAKKDVPTLDFIKQNEGMFRKAVEHKKFMESYLTVFNFLKDKNEESKVPALIKAIPKELEENEVVIKLKHHYDEPKNWGDNSICIFALTDLEDWSPKAIDKGIGGSEEAVIYLSRELAALGYEVTVFNNCGEQEGTYHGVHYKNVIDFNIRDNFNILISWRTNIFSHKLNAKKKIIWLHDIPQLTMTKEQYNDIDKIVVLSQFHASQLPYICPKEKVYISTNGINAVDFIGLDDIPRESHRCIYASSYNRGLERLLEIWPEVRKEVPDATLHIYYGWGVYDSYVKGNYMKDGGFKEMMTNLMNQPGVFEHGKVGHKELLKEYAKSEVFAYPCTYLGEINCIALTKAIATGCTVVSNNHQIMMERSPYPTVSNEEYKDYLIRTLKNGVKGGIVDKNKYIENNSWEAVAKDWKMNLFKSEPIEVTCDSSQYAVQQ
jgi:glycosyltransferase involved in cell wall biosynthesis